MAEVNAPDPTREAPPEPPVSYQEFLGWEESLPRVMDAAAELGIV